MVVEHLNSLHALSEDITKSRPYGVAGAIRMTQSNPDHKPENPDRESDSRVDEIGGQRDEGATYHVQNDESVTEGVVRAVSCVMRSGPTELEPLYSVVDTDALNALFPTRETGKSRRTTGVVAFDYAGNRVQVTSGGRIEVKKGASGGRTSTR